MRKSELPCNFDHNGECLICDCWGSDCAWERLKREDYKWESREELLKMFQDFIREKNLNVIINNYK
jgi:hypothetical protein